MKKNRKQVYELAAEDLRKFPVWEFALDEESEEDQDEATVRPYKVSGTLDASKGMFIVAAAFTLADGSEMTGYLSPPNGDDASFGRLQPVIVSERGQVGFWYGMLPISKETLTESYEKLGRDAAKIFPIQVTSNVKFIGSPVRATIPGFMVMEDRKSEKTRVVK